MTKYIYHSTLINRGWTKKSIDLFLPTPDKTVPNPNYKKTTSKLYDLSKVESIEKSNEFKLFQEKNAKKVLGSQKAVETKRVALIKYIKDLVIEVPQFDKETITQKACDHYNSGYNRYVNQPATPDSDTGFLNRITLNFLRHTMTDYEKQLNTIWGKVGNSEAYQLLKEKVNNAIKEKYNWL